MMTGNNSMTNVYKLTDELSQKSWFIETDKRTYKGMIEDAQKQIRWSSYNQMSELELKHNLKVGYGILEKLNSDDFDRRELGREVGWKQKELCRKEELISEIFSESLKSIDYLQSVFEIGGSLEELIRDVDGDIAWFVDVMNALTDAYEELRGFADVIENSHGVEIE
jgi:hypothetical protein